MATIALRGKIRYFALLTALACILALLALQLFLRVSGETLFVPIAFSGLDGFQVLSDGVYVQQVGSGEQLELHSACAGCLAGMSIYTLAPFLPLLAFWVVAWMVFARLPLRGSMLGGAGRKKLGVAVLAAGFALLLFLVVRGVGAYLAGASGIAAIPVEVPDLSPTFGISETLLLVAVLGSAALLVTGMYMVRSRRQ